MIPLMATDSQPFLELNYLKRGIVEDPYFIKRDRATDRDNAKLKTSETMHILSLF